MTQTAIEVLSKSKRPAYLAKAPDAAKAFNDFFSTGTAYNGLPVLSIGGKVFTMKLGDKNIVARNEDGDTMSTMLLVLGAARASKSSKSWYDKEFSENGEHGMPDCHSDDGITPALGAKTPQCASCASCAWNQMGTARQGEGKACRDFKRLIVVPYNKEHGLLRDPATDEPQGLALNVPVMSFKSLNGYIKELADAGIPANAVITKVRFVAESKFPQLEFSAAGFLSEEQYEEVSSMVDNEKWKTTVDIGPAFTGVVEKSKALDYASGSAKPANPESTPAAKKVAPKVAEAEEPAPAPKKQKKAAEEPAPAPKKAAAENAKAEVSEDDDLLAELEDWGIGGDDDE